MGERQKTLLNLVAAAVAFSANIIINFFMSPYIIEQVGIEAYGFYQLANNFVMYISLITIAVNSMASRFITIAFHKGDAALAQVYYSGVLAADFVLGSLIITGSLAAIGSLDTFLNVPESLSLDVKLLFAAVVLNFILGLFSAIFSVGYVIANQLYLFSIVQIKANFSKLFVLLALFGIFEPHVAYLGAGIFFATLYTMAKNYVHKKRLVPSLAFKGRSVAFARLKEVMSAGIWSSVAQVGHIFSGNLDLLLVNIYLTPAQMGTLAVVKIVPNLLSAIAGTLSNVYMPTFLRLYAQKRQGELMREIKFAMKVLTLVLSLPLVVLLALGDAFFALWLPGEDAAELYLLSCLALLDILVIAPVYFMASIFILVNKVKINSLLLVFTGALTTAGGYFILKCTDWGLVALVALGVLLAILRDLFYTVPFGARYLGERWTAFFPLLGRALFCIVLVAIVGRVLNNLVPLTGWLSFFAASLLLTLLMIAVVLVGVFDSAERSAIGGKLLRAKNKLFGDR